MTRRLFYIPVIHAGAELGAAEGVAQLRRVGSDAAHKQAEIARLWEDVGRWIESFRDLANVCIYQDGLPVCGQELQIVKDLAHRGSRNHRLLVGMLDRGAKLVGSEDPDLLLAEYRHIRNAIDQASDAEPAVSNDSSPASDPAELLAARDRFIADRIAATLGEGQCGVLFIGLLHRVFAYLDPDIVVEFPLIDPRGVHRESATG